jgi:DNA polymerase-3 subunit alpha
VYDVSRFSRGDLDEAGYLRHQFRQAGVEVIYCNENLSGGDADDLVVGVKQWMAAKFVKDLSKVTIRGVIWDNTLSRLNRQGNVPKIGDVVAMSGKVSVRTTSVGDEESGAQETITTKELNISEVWPITSGEAPQVDLGGTVIDFASEFKRLRAVELAPARAKKAAAPKAAPAEPEDNFAPDEAFTGQGDAPGDEDFSNVVSLDEHRTRDTPQWVGVTADEFSHILGRLDFIDGDKGLLRTHDIEDLPLKGDSLESGSIMRCLTTVGDRIFVIAEGGSLSPAEMLEIARRNDEVEDRWVPIKVKESAATKNRPKCSWSKMVPEPASGTGELLAG